MDRILGFLRYLLLFWLGFLPLTLIDAVQARHGQGEGGVVTFLLSMLFAAVLAGLSRVTIVPVVRRWAFRGGTPVSSDALAVACGASWAVSSFLLTRASTSLFLALAGAGVVLPVVWLALSGALTGFLPRLRPALRAPSTGAVAGILLVVSASICAWAVWGDAQRRAQSAILTVSPKFQEVTNRPDVTVIVLDTARAELLGGDFEGQAPMPWFDEYARGGRSWRRGYAAANRTPPGHAALFTGIFPADCGALPNGNVALGPDQFTLAEQLSAFGWRCAAVVSNLRIASNYGFQQGFEVYDDSLVSDRVLTATAKRLGLTPAMQATFGRLSEKVAGALLMGSKRPASSDLNAVSTARKTAQVLDDLSLKDEEPLFLFVNFIDPHLLYETRPELAAEFGPNLQDEELEALRTQGLPFTNRVDKLAERIEAGEIDAEADQKVRWVREAYFEQSRELDEGLRALIEDLERRGRAGPEDIVFITADHGEELGHHAKFFHGTTMFEGTVRVPFLLRAPNVPAGVDSSDVVSSVDFFPTVLTAAGMKQEQWPDRLAGYPLQAPIPADRLIRFESGPLRGFICGDQKMIAFDHGDRLEWLYAFDLGVDPGEYVNLFKPGAPAWVREFVNAPPFAPSRAANEFIPGGIGGPDLAELGYANELESGGRE